MSNELSIFEAMGGTYRTVDGILYPNISECSDNTLSVTITDVGKYGLIWISYMKENHIDRYRHHIRMGQLHRKAQEVNEQVYEMLDSIMNRYLASHKPKDTMNTINKSIKDALFRAYNTRNRNNKNQKRFDVIFGTIFFLCLILTIAAFGLMGANVKAGVIMLLVIFLCFGAAVTYALLRKKRIMKLLYSVPVGAENIEKIDVKQVEILNQLYEESALTIGMEAIPDEEFFNILYNWLIGMNALPEGKLKLYYLTGKLWNQRFACKVNDDTQILCIAMGDLNINAENTEQFSYEHMVFGRYLDDIVTGG